MALAVPAFAGCATSIPPRKVKNAPGHMYRMRGGARRMALPRSGATVAGFSTPSGLVDHRDWAHSMDMEGATNVLD